MRNGKNKQETCTRGLYNTPQHIHLEGKEAIISKNAVSSSKITSKAFPNWELVD